MKKRPNEPPPFRSYLRIALWAVPLQFILFKCCYPFADFFNDSYTYIDTAVSHDLISYRPVGYSVFLSLVHMLTASDTFLVGLQYLLVQASCGYLFYTLRYFISPSRTTDSILFLFLLLDPAALYISNYVSSDALFAALTLFWIAELIWLIHRPSWRRLFVQTILLALIFEVRYNALFYPLIAALAFVLSSKSTLFKATGIICSLLVVTIEIMGTRALTLKATGTPVFSAFSGWQIANNALHIFPHIPADSADLPSPECRQLDRLVSAYFDQPASRSLPSTALAFPAVGKGFHTSSTILPSVTTEYMWNEGSPLKKYFSLWREQHRTDYFTTWNRVSPTFSQYGYYLVRRHPVAFSRYYLLPSAVTFFLPPMVELSQYNEGKNEVDPVARDWFRYKTNQVHVVFPTLQRAILSPMRWIYLAVNLLFIITGIGLLRAAWLRRISQELFISFLLIGAFWGINCCFSIFAAPNVLRYQLLPLLLIFSFTVLAGEKLFKSRD